MLWRLFQKLEPTIFKLYQRVSYPPVPNLLGDRDIENSWVAANMPEGPGAALDFGCGPGWLGLLAARKGFVLTAIDLQPVVWYYQHPSLNFVQGDILKLPFSPGGFDLIINCSTVEHVGLSGRYGVKEDCSDGDMEAMALLRKLLKPHKRMLLTVPVGRDRIHPPLHRIYGGKRLPALLQGWDVIKKEYWIKDEANRWTQTEESLALEKAPSDHCYGLGLFVLSQSE